MSIFSTSSPTATMKAASAFRCAGRAFRIRISPSIRLMSDSISYSGGQATAGQGGYYGSGGSRVSTAAPHHHPEALARQTDIEDLATIMNTVEKMENELATLTTVSARSIELKQAMSKTISNPQVLALLDKLEIKGEPVW